MAGKPDHQGRWIDQSATGMQSAPIEFRADPAFHIGLRIPFVFMAEFIQSLGDFVDVFFTDRSCSAINAAEFAQSHWICHCSTFLRRLFNPVSQRLMFRQYVMARRSVGMHIQHKACIAARGTNHPFCIYKADTIIGAFSKTISCRHTTDAANDGGLRNFT